MKRKKEWYFVSKIVLTYCEKKMFLWSRKTFEIRGWRSRICKTFVITRTIFSNSKRSEQFLKQNAFLTCSWRFLRSNRLCRTTTIVRQLIFQRLFSQKNIYRDPSILPSLFGTSGVIMSSTSWLLGTSLVSGTWKVKLVEINRLPLIEFIKTVKDDVLSKWSIIDPKKAIKVHFKYIKWVQKLEKNEMTSILDDL